MSREIIEYRPVYNRTSGRLEEEVQEMIKNGWQPYRDFIFTGNVYFQVMVKYRAEEEIVPETLFGGKRISELNKEEREEFKEFLKAEWPVDE